MTPAELFILLALTMYALYRQSIRHEVTGRARFKLAITYVIVGIAVGGFYWPINPTGWLILIGSVVLSISVGLARGRWTRLWIEPDGRAFSQGTPFTIALFLLLVGSKWIIGAIQYLNHQPLNPQSMQHSSFGEVLILIAIMTALQAEIIWRRRCLLVNGASRNGLPF